MIEIRRSALVRYSPAQMFDLVNDVEAYPRRFSWCSAAEVLSREPSALTARLELNIGGLRQQFSTRNTLDPPQRIAMAVVVGPFRRLAGAWDFRALGSDGTKVLLALDFDYAGTLMAPVMRLGFQRLADRMVDEFCREAEKSYG